MAADDPVLSSTKPYLMRAIYEWILDNNLTPHLLVDATYPGAEVPAEHVEDGQIVLNLSPSAVRDLVMGNEWISFGARFGGVARQLLVPTEAVLGIFTRENRHGMVFGPTDPAQAGSVPDVPATPPVSRPTLKGVRPSLVDANSGDKKPGGPKGPGRPKGGPGLKVVK